MPDNPYAPPKTTVADRGTKPRPPRPTQITAAAWLIYSSVALGILHAPFASGITTALQQNPAMTIGVMVGSIGIVLVFGTLAIRGHNWARILFAILLLIGVVPSLISIPAMFQESWHAGLVFVLQSTMQAVAVYLMFARPGADWYRAASVS